MVESDQNQAALGERLTEEERIIVAAFRLFGREVREAWMLAAKSKIAKVGRSRQSCVIDMVARRKSKTPGQN